MFFITAKAEGDKFLSALRNCSQFSDTDVVNVNGIDAKSYKQMTGWENDKCTYKETVMFGPNKITTTCRFSKPQIKEIVSVADAYYLTLKYTNHDIDLSSTDAVKNNPVVVVMNKYLQDPTVCTMTGLE